MKKLSRFVIFSCVVATMSGWVPMTQATTATSFETSESLPMKATVSIDALAGYVNDVLATSNNDQDNFSQDDAADPVSDSLTGSLACIPNVTFKNYLDKIKPNAEITVYINSDKQLVAVKKPNGDYFLGKGINKSQLNEFTHSTCKKGQLCNACHQAGKGCCLILSSAKGSG